uniref:SWIM-type domain-containing protein n=1 Tax=Chenopodium quinoa TaxID=63459 RepID=A0A803M2U3_CHEQI
MQSVVKIIERGQKQIWNMRVIQVDLHEFEVDDEQETFVVNLENKTCGCYRWTLMGIPCWHALACIAKRRLNYEDFIHPAYHIATYAATYAPAFHAMPGHNQWGDSDRPQP